MRQIFVLLLAGFLVFETASADRPNIIFIMADDMGYGELGCYGQKKIRTPNIDAMARDGTRFTRFYAGSTVCAPSRSVLMTGKHTGHTTVRGNAGVKDRSPQMLRSEDVTVAEVLKEAGYATGLIGKWGLGLEDEGHPNRQGFDYFFGYLSQHHAHNHFPDYLWRNFERVPLENDIHPMSLDGAGYATNRVSYAGDLFAKEAVEFLEKNRERPFFLYLAPVVPHANNERRGALGDGMEVPDYGIYEGEDWSPQLKGHAAMVTRLDRDVGQVLKKLKELGLAENTIVFFTSDNGPHKEGGQDPNFFDPNGPFRGFKRELTDGGVRIPFIAWGPGTIKEGESDHVGYFGDVMTTLAQLGNAEAPENLDSISLVPTLHGKGEQKKHSHLYWEFHEGGFTQGVLIEGRWKGIRLKRLDAPIALYDLRNDPGEEKDVSAERPEVVTRVKELFRSARSNSPMWPIKESPKPKAES